MLTLITSKLHWMLYQHNKRSTIMNKYYSSLYRKSQQDYYSPLPFQAPDQRGQSTSTKKEKRESRLGNTSFICRLPHFICDPISKFFFIHTCRISSITRMALLVGHLNYTASNITGDFSVIIDKLASQHPLTPRDFKIFRLTSFESKQDKFDLVLFHHQSNYLPKPKQLL